MRDAASNNTEAWYAGLPYRGRRPLMPSERKLLASQLQMTLRVAWGGTCLIAVGGALAIVLPGAWMMVGALLVAAGVVASGQFRTAWRLKLAFKQPELRWFGGDETSWGREDARTYKITELTNGRVARPREVILSDRDEVLLVNGRPIGRLELYRLGAPHQVAAFIPTVGSRVMTTEEVEELKRRLRSFRIYAWSYVTWLAAWWAALAWIERADPTGFPTSLYVVVALVRVLFGIRGFVWILRVYPRLTRDLAKCTVVADPDGTQRLGASGTLWTDGDAAASWRTAFDAADGDVILTLPGLSSRAPEAETSGSAN